jgi:[acyl-carrier-protein] S-malonyltransferase
MGKIAFIFPGQASQYPGMGKEFYSNFQESRPIFEKADQALGFSLSQLCFSGPGEELTLTENAQPAILTVSIAAYSLLSSEGAYPHFVAGHSLGEYSALVAANSLTLTDAVRIVRNRGRYMQEAVPVGQGAMAAILGIAQGQVEALCQQAAENEVLATANLNSPSQVVIAGTASAVHRALGLAAAKAARKPVLLPVSAPFHCALMRPAQERLRKDLTQLHFDDLRFPLISNADAAEVRLGHQVADSLVRQMCCPVQWTASVQYLIDKGVGLFVEVGPGRVLSALVRQINKTVKTAHVEDGKSLDEALEIIKRYS